VRRATWLAVATGVFASSGIASWIAASNTAPMPESVRWFFDERDVVQPSACGLDYVPRPTETQRIVIGGDVTFANWVDLGLDIRQMLGGDFHPFVAAAPLFETADLVLVNLEMAAMHGRRQSSLIETQLGGSHRHLPYLTKAGIDAVSLANNHSVDYGRATLRRAANELRSLNLMPLGLLEETHHVFTLGNLKVAVVAVQSGNMDDGVTLDARREITIIPKQDAHRIGRDAAKPLLPWEAAIDAAEAASDFVIVYPHWGLEFTEHPTGAQRRLAHQMIDLGADLIVGSHPHIVQRIETIKSVPVVYSLGNLVFGLNELGGETAEQTDGAILVVDVGENGIERMELVPIVEAMATPIPVGEKCDDPRLLALRTKTLRRAYGTD